MVATDTVYLVGNVWAGDVTSSKLPYECFMISHDEAGHCYEWSGCGLGGLKLLTTAKLLLVGGWGAHMLKKLAAISIF